MMSFKILCTVSLLVCAFSSRAHSRIVDIDSNTTTIKDSARTLLDAPAAAESRQGENSECALDCAECLGEVTDKDDFEIFLECNLDCQDGSCDSVYCAVCDVLDNFGVGGNGFPWGKKK